MKRIKNLFEITSKFRCHVDISSIEPYGGGHINDTYRLKNLVSNEHDYLLQRINHHVFKDVPALMENMCRVTAHLKSKLQGEINANPEKEVVTLVPGKDGNFFYKDTNGDFWRMCYFLKNTRTYDIVETEKQAYEGGKAFGRFQAMLSDLSAEVMHEVIPDFHHIGKRLEQLNVAVERDVCGRVSEVSEELGLIRDHEESMLYFQQEKQAAELPKRVIHNDTKFNNVLLNLNDEAQCVIDLDTVMSGYLAYDFGDAIRTTINTREEDEANLGLIQLNIPLFNAYTRGYLREIGKFIKDSEVRSLVKGVLLLPYMQAVRFLTDHLNGDIYFKIKFNNHNLQRVRAQLQLFKMLNNHAEILNATILNEMEQITNQLSVN